MRKLKTASVVNDERKKADSVRRLYDDYFSRVYDRHMRLTNHYATEKKVIQKLLHYFRGRILDPCCGTGEQLKMVVELFGDDQRFIIANDFSEAMLGIARDKLKHMGSILFTTFDAIDIKLAEASVGTVLCSYSFNWFVDKETIASELAKTIVPGGSFISIEEFPFLVTEGRFMNNNIKEQLERTVMKTRLSGLDELIRILRNAGLDLIVAPVIEKIDTLHDMYGLVFRRPHREL